MNDALVSGLPETSVAPADGVAAEPIDCVVLGGGIAGLSAAYAAHRRGWSVRVLETRREVGGKVHSERKDGYLLEWGPNSFLGSHHTIWQLIGDLGLQNRVISAQLPADRFVYRNRRARRLPTGPLSLLTSDFMSFSGKMRMLAEPFIMRRRQARRFGARFRQAPLGRRSCAISSYTICLRRLCR